MHNNVKQRLLAHGIDFGPVIETLIEKSYAVGGKLFAKEFKQLVLEHEAENGNEVAQRSLKTSEFVSTLVGKAIPVNDDERLLNSYMAAIGILNGTHTLADILSETVAAEESKE